MVRDLSSRFRRAWCASTLALGLAGCLGNQSGHVEATKTGDTSHPAERGSPTDELRAACGGGEPTADGAIVTRQPYLQQVTTDSAMIGWVTTGNGGEHVEVTLPDGTPVTSAAGSAEQAVVRAAGEQQMWARIDGLQPDTIYCYSLENDTRLNERTGFRTAPAADSDRPIGVLAFGDSGGGGSDQLALADQMNELPYQLMIHTGDIAYDDGSIGEFEDNVFGIYAELFRNIPFFPAAGNHEFKASSTAAPFRAVFALPGDSGERWYSYDWGRVHFVALDTEADYATQAAWLDTDLAASPLPWKIVYFHRPPFSSGDHGNDTALQHELLPVFEKHHVQLVLAGHDHDYERIKPQRGVYYIVTGGGGKGTRPVDTSSFTELSNDVIHFVYLEIGADQLVAHAIDATGKEFDSVVIPRG